MQIAAAAMAPDASWVVVVTWDGTVRTLGRGGTRNVVPRAVAIDPGQPVAVALSGERLRVLWAAGGRIRLHEEGARPRNDVFAAPARVRALALSPSGDTAMVACDDGTLRRLDPGTGQFGMTLASGAAAARALAVASDQGPVVAAFPDGSVRRYDLATGALDIAGIHPGVRLIAVTPDGGTVVAAGADDMLVRWRPPPGSPPDFRALGTAVTALAADGTGGRVLAGAADGKLWLHDLAGGAPIEFGVPSAAAPWTPPSDLRGIVDNDVRFTVYRPRSLSPGDWAPLLVFAHKTDLVERPGRAPVDPVRQVEQMARARFGDTPFREGGEDARAGVFRGARLRVAADLPGVLCNPGEAEFAWHEPVHQVEFRLLAGPELVGSVVRGAVRVWYGPLLLGEVSLAISVTAGASWAESPAVAESAPRYRKIFPSYSHDDRAVVDAFAEFARALGDEYLQDVLALRSGERWRPRLPELIEEADIFQLFWSRNSMRSSFCREEWEHALALRRPLFVRPLYWEDPMPEDPALGLPPVALRELEFVKVRPYLVPGGEAARRAEAPPALAGSGGDGFAPPPPAPAPAPLGPAGPPPLGPAGPAPPTPAPPAPQGSSEPFPLPERAPLGRRRALRAGRRRGLVAAIAASGVAAAYLIFAVVTLTGPFARHQPPSVTASSPHPTLSPGTTPAATSAGPTLAPGVAPLIQLLPRDVDDPATQCARMAPPFKWEMPGLVQAMTCTAPGLRHGQVYAFQMDSGASFETAWRNFSQWWGIASLTPGPDCPPPAGGAGTVGFHNEFFPPRPGQVLECETVGSGRGAQPAYAWAYPAQDAFIVAQGAPGSSFSALDNWWTGNSTPLSSPRS
jgi:TIR domain